MREQLDNLIEIGGTFKNATLALNNLWQRTIQTLGSRDSLSLNSELARFTNGSICYMDSAIVLNMKFTPSEARKFAYEMLKWADGR